MKKISTWKQMRWMVWAAGVLAVAALAGVHTETAWATSAEAVSDNIVVREEAVDGAQIGSLYADQEVTITGQTEGSDGNVWYEITFEGQGEERSGWVRSDLVEETDPSAGAEDPADGGEETPAAGQDPEATGADTVRVQIADGYVDLADVPQDAAALVSDRFVPAVCQLADGSVQAYQLAGPDEMVSADADLTVFYYVYGTNELGEQGWYTYDSETGTLQKSLTNMQYALPQPDSTAQAGDSDDGGMDRMLLAGAGLVCILLLVLVIVVSVRYRRLRRLLEEASDFEEETAEVRKEIPEERPEKKTTVKKSGRQKNERRETEKEAVQIPVVEEEGYDLPDDDSYDIYDLDDLDQILDAEKATQPQTRTDPEKTLKEQEPARAAGMEGGEDAELERILREESEKLFGLKTEKTGQTEHSGKAAGSGKKKAGEQAVKELKSEKEKKKEEIPDLPEDIEFVDDGIDDDDLEFL